MKSFVLALLAMIVVAVAASVVLNSTYQRTADQAYTTSGARLGEAH